MKFMDHFKDIPTFYNNSNFEFYSNLKKPSVGKLSKGFGRHVTGIPIELNFVGKRFEWTISEVDTAKGATIYEKRESCQVEILDTTKGHLILDDFHARSWNSVIKGTMISMRNKSFTSRKAYYKVIIPVRKSHTIINFIQTKSFNLDQTGVARTGTAVELEDEILELLITDDKFKNRFLVIQSRIKQEFDAFEEKLHKITVALGYITGYYAGGECCYFLYNSKELKDFKGYKYKVRRPELNLVYVPVTANPHSWIKDRGVAKNYYKHEGLKDVSIEIFSNFCKKILSNENFFTAVLLLIESTSASLLMKPIGYAVVLESLRDIIVDKTVKVNAPIVSKRDSKDFRAALSEILNDHASRLESFQDVSTIQFRIDEINKTKNADKLSTPFISLGLELSDADLMVLNSRNDFLHGRIADYDKMGADRTVDQENEDLFYASARFYTLLSKLLMKYLGYTGLVVNYSKLHENLSRYSVDEPPYIAI